MVYSKNLLQCIFAVYILQENLTYYGSAKHTAEKKIDEILEKLLVSHKIDRLADKIAEKAVEKILMLQPNLTILNSPEKLIQNKAFLNTSIDTELHIDQTPSFKNLSLKYNRFTTEPAKNNSSEESNEKMNNPNENKADSNNIRNDEESTQISIFESDQLENFRSVEIIGHFKNEHSKEMQENKEEKSDEVNESNKEGSITAENRKNEINAHEESESNSVDHKSNMEPYKDEKSSDFDDNVKRDEVLFGNPKYAAKAPALKKSHKKRIRKAGHRFYTFASSSDYDEYHQELDRIEKDKNVFRLAFL